MELVKTDFIFGSVVHSIRIVSSKLNSPWRNNGSLGKNNCSFKEQLKELPTFEGTTNGSFKEQMVPWRKSHCFFKEQLFFSKNNKFYIFSSVATWYSTWTLGFRDKHLSVSKPNHNFLLSIHIGSALSWLLRTKKKSLRDARWEVCCRKLSSHYINKWSLALSAIIKHISSFNIIMHKDWKLSKNWFWKR